MMLQPRFQRDLPATWNVPAPAGPARSARGRAWVNRLATRATSTAVCPSPTTTNRGPKKSSGSVLARRRNSTPERISLPWPPWHVQGPTAMGPDGYKDASLFRAQGLQGHVLSHVDVAPEHDVEPLQPLNLCIEDGSGQSICRGPRSATCRRDEGMPRGQSPSVPAARAGTHQDRPPGPESDDSHRPAARMGPLRRSQPEPAPGGPSHRQTASNAAMATDSSFSVRLQWLSHGCGHIRPRVAGKGLVRAITRQASSSACSSLMPFLDAPATTPRARRTSVLHGQLTRQGAGFSVCAGRCFVPKAPWVLQVWTMSFLFVGFLSRTMVVLSPNHSS